MSRGVECFQVSMGGASFALALLACGAPPAPLAMSTDLLEVVPVLHFEPDGSVVASGTLVAGGRVRIDYAPERARCQGWTMGRPFWSATGRYRINGGPEERFEAGGIQNDDRPDAQVIELPESGELELGFESNNGWGCHATDPASASDRFRFPIVSAPLPSGWAGRAVSAISRASCDEPGCPSSAKSLEEGFTYDDWASSRAVVHEVAFDVWVPGVTDVPNPRLWRDLDVRIYSRFGGRGPFFPHPVSIAARMGHDARYAFDLAELDPFIPEGRPYRSSITSALECPPVPVSVSMDGRSLRAEVELYFTINGVVFQASNGQPFRGVYETSMSVPGVCVPTA